MTTWFGAWLHLALACPATVLVPPRLAPEDRPAYRTALTGCARHFPDSPCLVRFERRAPLTYWATCGGHRAP